MKKILVLGAGLSAKYLIHYLLKHAVENDWLVMVAEVNLALAKAAVKGNSRGTAIQFDINDELSRAEQIKNADIVVNMLPPKFQYLLALDCVHHGRYMISASYQGNSIPDLHKDARRKGILILTEMGLDPGIDLMLGMSIIEKVRLKGGKIKSFKSYGGAIPSPDSLSNPLKYLVTWNPRNVVMSGENGAQYFEKGKIKLVPYHNVFQDSWMVKVDGIGDMEVYPNRETLAYRSNFEIKHAETIIRGTIRYPGWCETWQQIVKLGIPNEHLHIPDVHKMTYRDFTELFLPRDVTGSDFEARLANFLNINPTGSIMGNLKWLGLFSEKVIGNVGKTPTAVMVDLLHKKLKMEKNDRDMVILHTEAEAFYKNGKNKREKTILTLIEEGEKDGFTAITKTVGLPVAIGIKLILSGKISLTGCYIPTVPEIYKPVLKELKKEGLKFKEKTTVLK